MEICICNKYIFIFGPYIKNFKYSNFNQFYKSLGVYSYFDVHNLLFTSLFECCTVYFINKNSNSKLTSKTKETNARNFSIEIYFNWFSI